MIASTASNFFSSGTWLVIRNLLFFFAAVVWLATLYWIYKDAKRRIEDPWVVGVSVLVGVVVPFFGPFIYMLFRPPEYLEDVRERELEIKAMEDRLSKRDLHCPVCRSEVDATLPRLPDLHDEAEAGVRELQGAARGAVAGLPALRDGGRADCGHAAALRVPSSPPRRIVTVPRRWPWRRHSS